jgi:hypothetical protein
MPFALDLQSTGGSAMDRCKLFQNPEAMKHALKFIAAAATASMLSMCGAGYDRATLDNRPNEGAVAAEPASRSGSSPEGGSSSPSIGRTALPPEQPRR